MPQNIVWLPGAVKDVERLRGFIRSKNPIAARRAAVRILEGVTVLKLNPNAGIPVEGLSEYRELILTFGAGDYFVRYRVDSSDIVIVRVRHSKEQGF